MTQLTSPSKEKPPWFRWAPIGALWVAAVILYLFLDHVSQVPESLLLPVLVVHAGASGLTAHLLLHFFLTTGRLRTLAMSVAFSYAAFTIAAYRIALPISDNRILGIRHEMAPAFWALWHIGFALLLTISLAVPKIARRQIWSMQNRKRLAVASVLLSVILATAGMLTVIIDKGATAEVRALRLVPHYLHDWLNAVNTSVASSVDLATWSIYLSISALSIVALVATYRLSRSLNQIEGWVTIAAATSLLGVLLTLSGETVNSGGWYVSSMVESLGAVFVVLAILQELLRLHRKSESDKQYLELQAAQFLQATRDANEREARISRIIQNAADPYIEVSAAGLITSWNRKAVEMFGRENKEVLDQPLPEVIMPGKGVDELNDLISELWQNQEGFDGTYAELLVKKADGNLLTVEATVWINDDPESARMSFFLRDVTPRKREEERLNNALRDERMAALKLQEIDRDRANFVSSVSHELRSPLTSMVGYLELLLDGDVGKVTQKQHHMLEKIHRNAARLTALIEDLLTVNRIDKNALPMEHHLVNLGEVIERAVQRHKTPAERRRVTLTYESGFDLGGCPGDSDLIERAIFNIVSNAVKFTAPGGIVSVLAEPHGHQVAIVISDNGIGIAKEEQSELFKAFHRSQHVIDNQHQGTGLGLTIARAIVEKHHGEINLESRLGKGTTVTIFLPAVPLTSPTADDSPGSETADDSPGTDTADNATPNESPDVEPLPSTVET